MSNYTTTSRVWDQETQVYKIINEYPSFQVFYSFNVFNSEDREELDIKVRSVIEPRIERLLRSERFINAEKLKCRDFINLIPLDNL